MVARDIMTTPVVTVTTDALVADIARLLLTHHISAVPVVNSEGRVVGIVSEGDLMRRPETGGLPDRSWWLALLAGSKQLARDYVRAHGVRAEDVMSRDVVSVTEDTPLHTIAQLLEEHRIKRVPVLREGQLVGIVSRADLLRGLASRPSRSAVLPRVDDRMIRERVVQTLQSLNWATPAYVSVIVTDGVVHLWGVATSEEERKAVRIAAGGVPGVRGVDDHLGRGVPWVLAE